MVSRVYGLVSGVLCFFPLHFYRLLQGATLLTKQFVLPLRKEFMRSAFASRCQRGGGGGHLHPCVSAEGPKGNCLRLRPGGGCPSSAAAPGTTTLVPLPATSTHSQARTPGPGGLAGSPSPASPSGAGPGGTSAASRRAWEPRSAPQRGHMGNSPRRALLLTPLLLIGQRYGCSLALTARHGWMEAGCLDGWPRALSDCFPNGFANTRWVLMQLEVSRAGQK